MGDPGSADTWKKLVIAKANNEWVSISSIKKEQHSDDVDTTGNFSLDYDPPQTSKRECVVVPSAEAREVHDLPPIPEFDLDPLLLPMQKKDKPESTEERASRLAKMSAYAAQRLANETPEQRATRLKRMSEYAAKRLANETSEQRAKRLARMSAYAAKRLAEETPEQRQARLTRMSAYAAKRHAMKKNGAATLNLQSKRNLTMATQMADHYEIMSKQQNQS